MNNLAKQSEILFIWDAKMCNPNGDMSADNAPRFDDVDEKAIVSDVRVKRTIRDDLQYRKSEEIFINNEKILESGLKAEGRFDQLKGEKEYKDKDEKEVFLQCIDNRLFGGVAPKSNIQLIGPVQFCWAKTLNKTETILKSGTGAFATEGSNGETKYKKTFRADNYIPYGLFAMYGSINRMHAERTGATEDDIKKMLDSLWFGTKLLNTRSKEGQKPRMLIRVIYNESSKYFIGLLDELVKLENEDSEMLRSVEDANINFDKLIKAIENAKQFIEKIEVTCDSSMEKYKEVFKKINSDNENKVETQDEFDLIVDKESA
ncbi:CRISPR-associated protein Csh2 [Candidatus Kuenenia stuttgartiensis]|uniref:CRISPR-associated protein Csh2 n=1 Tax=Kuenenia stuttgartiensis TaxID=174633 RepID=A0A6G7GMD0_KUEST|nr:type I-B CRISPR-associated protein Cas7/Csh2 [Candidatus Kuenenia stuttgartiensis]QII10706.1 CRISPR-associated protein Csh2 [Candidatus Kuenenia stuttgartiensis]